MNKRCSMPEEEEKYCRREIALIYPRKVLFKALRNNSAPYILSPLP